MQNLSNRSPPALSHRLDNVNDLKFKTPKAGHVGSSFIRNSTSSTSFASDAARLSALTSADLHDDYRGKTDHLYGQQLPAGFRHLSPDLNDTTTFDSPHLKAGPSVGLLPNSRTATGDPVHTKQRLSDPVHQSLAITDAAKLERRSHDTLSTVGGYGSLYGHQLDVDHRLYAAQSHDLLANMHRSGSYAGDFSSTYHQIAVPPGDRGLGRQMVETDHRMADAAYHGFQRSFPRCASTSAVCGSHMTEIDMMKQTADSIIKEKDHIIEVLRQQLNPLQGALYGGPRMDHSIVSKCQELQFENATLKARVADLLAAKQHDQESFDRRLGATEYELHQMKLSNDSKLHEKDDEVLRLQSKITEYETSISGLKTRCNELKEENESLKKNVGSSKRYLQDLPTASEHAANLQTIAKMKEDKEKSDTEKARLEKKLTDALKGQMSRDQMIETLQQTCTQLGQDIDGLKKRNDELLAKLSADKDLALMAQLESENERLKADCYKAKKLLESKQSQFTQQQLTSQNEQKLLKERIDQESATVDGLKRALDEKERQIRETIRSLNELTVDHQRLTEHCLKTEDQLNELRQQNTAELSQKQRQLVLELTACVMDLRSLIDVCKQCANNEEPNIAALLGVRHTAVPNGAEASDAQAQCTSTVNSLKYQINKVKELRSEIDNLRCVISDRFAEDMGRRLTCNPQ